jgi:hypothetical protein
MQTRDQVYLLRHDSVKFPRTSCYQGRGSSSDPRARTEKVQICRAFQAADGTRTHDLLHGKQTPIARSRPLCPANGPLLRRGDESFFPRVSSRFDRSDTDTSSSPRDAIVRFDGIVSPNCPRGSCAAGARRCRARGTSPKSPARMPSTGRRAGWAAATTAAGSRLPPSNVVRLVVTAAITTSRAPAAPTV